MNQIKQYAIKHDLPLELVAYIANDVDPLMNPEQFDTMIEELSDAIGEREDHS